MRLLLDEHYPKEIAAQLRKRGHDVDCVQERAELLTRGDDAVFAAAVREERAVVTEDVRDYVRLLEHTIAGGDDCFGLLITSPRTLPRTQGGIGLIVRTLDAFLRIHASRDALVNQVRWLEPPSTSA